MVCGYRIFYSSGSLIAQIKEAKAQGHDIKPTLVGPLTLLWLGKKKEEFGCRIKTLLPKLLPVYAQLLRELAAEGVDWIQIDGADFGGGCRRCVDKCLS